MGTSRPNPSSSTVHVPGTVDECVCCQSSCALADILERSPVKAAYITSLESQISSLRDELATVYKTQGQNAQRLLAMTETLREKEELSRIESENLRRAREEIHILRKKVEQHNELMSEKDRTHQVRYPSPHCSAKPYTPGLGATRRDQHASTRAGPDRRTQSGTC